MSGFYWKDQINQSQSKRVQKVKIYQYNWLFDLLIDYFDLLINDLQSIFDENIKNRLKIIDFNQK